MSKMSLEIIKGFDRNHTPFSAFVICSEEDCQRIEKAKTEKQKLDFSNLEIVFKITGHEISEKIHKDVLDYIQSKNYTYAYNNILKQSQEIQRNGIDITVLPGTIEPKSQALLKYIQDLHRYQDHNIITLDSFQEKLIERALPDAESFYTDITGNLADY